MHPTAEEIAQRHHRRKEPAPMRDLTFNPAEQSGLAVMDYALMQIGRLEERVSRLEAARDYGYMPYKAPR